MSQPSARYLRELDETGNNSLVITNLDKRRDCVVLLYDTFSRRIGLYAYIPRNTEAEFTELPNGNYSVYFGIGNGWSNDYKRFEQGVQYFSLQKRITLAGRSRPGLSLSIPSRKSKGYRPLSQDEFEKPIYECARPWQNGEDFVSESYNRSGLGRLTIDNQTSRDAVVVLYDTQTRSPLSAVYVRRGNRCQVSRIPPGDYQVFFVLGVDWNPNYAEFSIVYYAKKFENELSFREIPQYGGIEYTTYRLTLHEVVGGTARTTIVSPNAIKQMLR